MVHDIWDHLIIWFDIKYMMYHTCKVTFCYIYDMIWYDMICSELFWVQYSFRIYSRSVFGTMLRTVMLSTQWTCCQAPSFWVPVWLSDMWSIKCPECPSCIRLHIGFSYSFLQPRQGSMGPRLLTGSWDGRWHEWDSWPSRSGCPKLPWSYGLLDVSKY